MILEKPIGVYTKDDCVDVITEAAGIKNSGSLWTILYISIWPRSDRNFSV